MDPYGEWLTRVVAVGNGKGGVGKTSTATNCAGLAAQTGWSVLLIDFDPQGDAQADLGYGDSDSGRHLVDAIQGRCDLAPVIRDVRPGLDVIPGGGCLDELDTWVVGAGLRSIDTRFLFAKALSGLAHHYDLIIIDTPPTRPVLLQQALAASRWVLIPTKSDRASIQGLGNLANELVKVRTFHPQIDVLGAVVFGVTSGATTVRQNAIDDVQGILGEDGHVFNTVIRHVEAAASDARYRNMLAHELAAEVENAEPFFEALKDGRTPAKLPQSATRLAGDYVELTIEVMAKLTEELAAESVPAEA